jgi:hypothetical protein
VGDRRWYLGLASLVGFHIDGDRGIHWPHQPPFLSKWVESGQPSQVSPPEAFLGFNFPSPCRKPRQFGKTSGSWTIEKVEPKSVSLLALYKLPVPFCTPQSKWSPLETPGMDSKVLCSWYRKVLIGLEGMVGMR